MSSIDSETSSMSSEDMEEGSVIGTIQPSIQKSTHSQASSISLQNYFEPDYLFDDYVKPKGKPIDVDERFYKYKTKVDEKVDKLAKELEAKHQEVCTFKPKIKSGKSKRTPDEFFSEMQRFSSKKEEKLNAMREEKSKNEASVEYSHRPNICENSLKLLQKKNQKSEPVFEKLYKQPKAEVKEDLPSFKPQLNSSKIKRNSSVSSLHEKPQKKQEQPPEATKFINSNSEKVLVSKFEKEFEEHFEFFDLDQELKLNYLNTCLLLQKMNFITNDPSSKHFDQEREHTLKLWKLTAAQQHIPKADLFQVLMGIMGYSAEASKKPHKQFVLFYENRINSVNSKKNKTYKHKEEYSFKPKIDQSSQKLAKARKNSLGSHEEYLYNMSKKVNEKKEKLKAKHEQAQKSMCTFKPKTSSAPKFKSPSASKKDSFTSEYLKAVENTPSQKRTETLYSLSKKAKEYKESLAKEALQAKAQELQKECTFTPKLYKSPSKPNSVPLAKGTHETVERMKKAREEQARIKAMKERGFTNCQPAKKTPKPRVSEDEELACEVLLPDGSKHTITIQENDDPRQVLNQFVEKHQLQPEFAQQLREQVFQAIQ